MPDNKKKDPVEDRAELRDEEPAIDDDLEEAQVKSRSVDERIPERYGVEDATDAPAPAPASYVPQGGSLVPRGEEDLGPGEQVLAKEQHRTTPRRPGSS